MRSLGVLLPLPQCSTVKLVSLIEESQNARPRPVAVLLLTGASVSYIKQHTLASDETEQRSSREYLT
jgi:hypothetical protein